MTRDIQVYNNSIYFMFDGLLSTSLIAKSNIFLNESDCTELFKIRACGFYCKYVTLCLWPNYYPSIYLCTPQLPIYILDQSYSIKVGRNVDKRSVFIPFEHCQNSRFLIRVCANDPTINGTCTDIEWVAINQTASSFQIDQNYVTSVGANSLWLQAQLITGLVQSFISKEYIVTGYVSLNFINNNCRLALNPSNIFIVVNQTKTFDVSFIDDENDNVIMKTINSAGIGIYIKPVNNSNFQVYLNCDDSLMKSASLVFSYTDAYHTDSTYWQEFSVDVNIFLSEPPVFLQPVQNMTVNICSQKLVVQILPSIFDPDSSLFKVSFLEQTPSWIYISTDNEFGSTYNYINVNCTSDNDCQPSSNNMPLIVMLYDDSGAWTKYSFNINFKSYNAIKFDQIENITIDISKSVQIPATITNKQFYAEECGTTNKIDWICYQSNKNFIFVFDQVECGFVFDVCDTINIIGSYCVQLFAIDVCGNKISSNQFNVTIKPFLSYSSTNSIESIIVYQNHYNSVEIPNHLFLDPNKISNYSCSSCNYDKSNSIATRISTDPTTNISTLFVKAYGDKGCNITIVDSNSYCQSSEVVAYVNVFSCSSKTCYQCKGPTDADCLECNRGYVLDSSGSCLVDTSFALNTNSTFYTICGIIAMTVAIVQITLTLRYGKDVLELLMHLQTFIMLSLSLESISDARLAYLSWIQIFKFDFGFINPLIRTGLACSTSSGRLFSAKLYCEDIFHNYFIVLCALFIICCFILMIRISQKYTVLISFILTSSVTTSTVWIFINIICPFFIISIYTDLMTIANHALWSLFTICFVCLLIAFCFRTKLYFLGYDFIFKLDPHNKSIYLYMQLLAKLECVIIFLSNSKLLSTLLIVVLMMTHTTLLFTQIRHQTKLPLQKIFDRAATLFGNSIMLLVIMIISVEKYSGSSIDQSINNLTIHEITADSVLALLITTMCICFLLISIIRIPCDILFSYLLED